ncbi:MAG TPA: hypothetical protein VHN77_09120 [Phycisphaerales bacterium]|nr:hypothetical protein [Phycisphaerales bacterium]
MRSASSIVVWVGVLVPALVCARAHAQDYSAPGPYPVGVRTVTVTRPNATTYTARLSYPAASAGSGTPFATAAAPAAAISFGHGFVQPTTQYATTIDHLASWGFIVIAPNSETGLFPSHANFASDLRHALTYLEQQTAVPGSFLQNSVDTARFGMSGHSMGGGASILATADDARVRALANLAAAETTPSAVSAMARVHVPVSLIAGNADTIVPVANHGQLMYNAGAAPKLLPVISGGFHCGFTDATFFGCDSSPTLSRAQQLAVTRRLLAQFFLLTLRGQQQTWGEVWGPAAATDAQVNFAQRDPGITLTPSAAAVSGEPGLESQTVLGVMNTASLPRLFTMFAEPRGAPMVASVEPVVTGVVAPGATSVVTVRLPFPPAGGTLPISVVISARADDGSTRGFSTLSPEWLCSPDYNNDGLFPDTADIDDFLSVFSGGPCSTGACGDIDFNNDGLFPDTQDIDSLLSVFSGGPCL